MSLIGVILEVAKKDCGGEDGLKAAMSRGDVIKGLSENGKHILYFFPSADLYDFAYEHSSTHFVF